MKYVSPAYEIILSELASALISSERFAEVQPIAEIATVRALYPEIPETARIYEFPEIVA